MNAVRNQRRIRRNRMNSCHDIPPLSTSVDIAAFKRGFGPLIYKVERRVGTKSCDEPRCPDPDRARQPVVVKFRPIVLERFDGYRASTD